VGFSFVDLRIIVVADLIEATGRVEVATIGPSRTEKDFAAHVERTIDRDPNAGWVWVIDPLNTHMSESLAIEGCR
jgi:hypothetical protein